MKRDALDDIFSQCVREAADWTCERCGLEFPERKSQALHASHYYSRGIACTRHHPDNVSSLCGRCHKEVGEDPDAHRRWMLKRLGDIRYGELGVRKNTLIYRKVDKKAMRAHYRAELERMLAERRRGLIGPLELVAYD